MKTHHVLSVALIIALCSCSNKQEKPTPVKINFEISQIVPFKDVARPIRDSLQKTGILLGSFQDPEIGYLPVEDSSTFTIGAINEHIMLTITTLPIDDSNSLMAVFAVKPTSVIDNSFIKKVVANEKEVLITFNEEGASIWAAYTKKSIGEDVAFLLDNKVCYKTRIEGEISEGMAKITGLKSNEEAQILAYKLMKNLPM